MNGDYGELKIFSGRNSKHLAQRVVDHLKIPLGGARTSLFPDGEIITKLDDDVRGRDCFRPASRSMTTSWNCLCSVTACVAPARPASRW